MNYFPIIAFQFEVKSALAAIKRVLLTAKPFGCTAAEIRALLCPHHDPTQVRDALKNLVKHGHVVRIQTIPSTYVWVTEVDPCERQCVG